MPIVSGAVVAAFAGLGLGVWLQPELPPELKEGVAPNLVQPERDRPMLAPSETLTFGTATTNQPLSDATPAAPAVADSRAALQDRPVLQNSDADLRPRTQQLYAEDRAFFQDWSRARQAAPPASGPERDFFMPGPARSDPPRWREPSDEGHDVDVDEAPADDGDGI